LAGETAGLNFGRGAAEMVGAEILVEGASRSLWWAAVRIEAATAQMAFFGPRR